jgi:phospholipid/cholesterol/gamma-HCH transport system substrate-binding protein
MESKVNYALVGLFVLVLGFALIGFLFWLSVGGQDKVYDIYQASISESVSGLNQGASVKYRGVDVGRVKQITLRPDNPEEVVVLLEIERGTPVKQDTFAVLQTQGLTGLASVELTGGTKSAPPLLAEQGQRYPELKTKPSLMVRVDTAISLLLERMQEMSQVASDFMVGLNQLAGSANTLLSPENRQAITSLLQHVEHLTGGLAARQETLEQGLLDAATTFRYAAKASEQLPAMIEGMYQSALTVEKSALAFQGLSEQSQQILAENRVALKRTTEGLADTTSSLKNTATRSGQDMQHFTGNTLAELNGLIVDLRETLQVLRRVSRDLERKPDALLFGRPGAAPGPGE